MERERENLLKKILQSYSKTCLLRVSMVNHQTYILD